MNAALLRANNGILSTVGFIVGLAASVASASCILVAGIAALSRVRCP
ncbi:putative membrane protein [Brucella lupini]|uniref:Putative membrane protein n=1 Tax=Brucella lupini TaxID=255457 RepID=A0A256GH89_9HYPH|nr:putative membrane protein [Brucella lupini]